MKAIYKISLCLLLASCLSTNTATHDKDSNTPLPPPYKPEIVIPTVSTNFLTITEEDIGEGAYNCLIKTGKLGKATFSINNLGIVGGKIGFLGLDNTNQCIFIPYIWNGAAQITRVWDQDITPDQTLNVYAFSNDNSFLGTISSDSGLAFMYYTKLKPDQYIQYTAGRISQIINNSIYFSPDASYATINIGGEFVVYDLHKIDRNQVDSYILNSNISNIYGISSDGVYAGDEKDDRYNFYTPKICKADFDHKISKCNPIAAFNSYDRTTTWRTMGVSPNYDYIYIMSKIDDKLTSFISVNKDGATTRKITLPEAITNTTFTIVSITDKGDFLVKNKNKEIVYFYSYSNDRFYEMPMLMSMFFGKNRVGYAENKDIKLSANAKYMLLDLTRSPEIVDDLIAVRIVFPEDEDISDYLNLYWDSYQNSDKIWE